MQINKILFPTDFSGCAEAAFSYAAYLAEQYNAALHVLNVHTDTPDDALTIASLEEDDRKASLLTDERSVLAEIVGDAIPVIHAQLQARVPAEGILAYAREQDVDLIVMGTHGRRGIDRLMLGSSTEEVVRLANVPVLTVREASKEVRPVIRRILAPIDFSDFSLLGVQYATDLASAYGASLAVLHVLDETALTSAFAPSGGVPAFVPQSDELARRAQHRLDELIAQQNHEAVDIETFMLIGSPAQKIVQFAESHSVDLVVMASHGHTGMKRWLLGSVTEKVVRAAPCPTFTVKSFGKSILSPEAEDVVSTETS